ncbi:unnamed protein product [Symbiodinium sp. CCMP2592]|nr:unnamed protein product [Symbiodinium sp. CCMP2592]
MNVAQLPPEVIRQTIAFTFGSVLDVLSLGVVNRQVSDVLRELGESLNAKVTVGSLLTVGSMAFFAGLGIFDFVTDFIVMLQYGCFLDNSLTPDCPMPEANSTAAANVTLDLELPECKPHWAWFGIALTLVVLSTLVPPCCWAMRKAGMLATQEGIKNRNRNRLFFYCLGVAQLSQVWDLVQVLRKGDTEIPIGDMEPAHVRNYGGSGAIRNLLTVVFESAPQLYLQSYVLFALGAYGQTFKVMSVCSSVLSLASSAVMAAPTVLPNKRLASLWPGKVLAMLFIATDAAVRSIGFAMVLSEPVRAYGLPTSITFFLLCNICICRSDVGVHRAEAVFFLPYIVPVYVLLQDKKAYRASRMEIVLALRYIETILFGILAGTLGETACGSTLTTELGIYFGMLVANALSLVLFQCFVDDDGEFSTPRQSTYSPGQILGRPMQRMPDTE